MKTTLLIMAAGIGSRFGTGIKQLVTVDEKAHIIMDYSVHDAIDAGFNKIVFVIRKDIEEEFKEVIGNRIEEVCRKSGVEVGYAFQDIRNIPGKLPEGRTKPWGTGQAVMAAKEEINTPFAVINADDYYGKNAFAVLHECLCDGKDEFCMAGFVLKNTLSDNGGVTRGICKVKNSYLADIVETHNIEKTNTGARSGTTEIYVNSLVSMNMWGFTPAFMEMLDQGFKDFFTYEVKSNPMKAEFLIPTFIGSLLKEKKVNVKVLKTDDSWYGMTYKADVEPVRESFRQLIECGIYTKDLFDDLIV